MSTRIQQLPVYLINQIAAGEIIERPASVLKELLENSLDAGSQHIEVQVEQGGIQLLRVRDDGVGIHPDDLSLALCPHATSKLKSFTDLTNIRSLGFRGEALASLCAVSELRLVSRSVDTEVGHQILGTAAKLNPVIPVPHPLGTTVEMRHLFYNVPARRQFLRSTRTEFVKLEQVFKAMALMQFPVGWLLEHNGKRVRHLKPCLDEAARLERLGALCGKSFVTHAVRLEAEANGLRLWGWLVPPRALRQDLDVQYLYVNGRMVRDRLLGHAVRQAFEEVAAERQAPAYVLYLELDPSQVDVNVHPTKHEVRFREARQVHAFLGHAIQAVLVPSAVARPAAKTMVDNKVRSSAGPSLNQSNWGLLAQEQSVTAVPKVQVHPWGLPVYLLHSTILLTERPQEYEYGVIQIKALYQAYIHHALAQGAEAVPLLLPHKFKVEARLNSFLDWLAPLQALGCHIDQIDPHTFLMRAIPRILPHTTARAIADDLIAAARQGLNFKGPEIMSCLAQAAARGACTSLQEAKALLASFDLDWLQRQGRGHFRGFSLAELLKVLMLEN